MKAKLLKFLKKTKLLNLKNKFKRPYVYNEQVIFTVGAICKYLKIDIPKKYQDISKKRVDQTKLISKLQNKKDIENNTKKQKNKSVEYYRLARKYFREFKIKYDTQECLKDKSNEKLLEMAVEGFYTFRSYGFNYNDYFDYELYNKKISDLPKFLNSRYRTYIYKLLNDREVGHKYFKDKYGFNKKFAKYVNRDFVIPYEQGKEEFEKFVKKHPRFFAKPVGGTGGYDAGIMELKDNFDELYNKIVEGKYICEEIVKQHKDLAAFNSDTLNTCRLYTLLKTDGKAYVTMANSRYGRKGNEVDNFHSGGVSAGIDVETGKVVTDAINRAHMKCVKHPDSGLKFKGSQIPLWEEAVKAVTEMAETIPEVRHIGWDVAFTSDNKIELIEGNAWPNFDITQAVDQKGKMHRYEKHIKEWEEVLK